MARSAPGATLQRSEARLSARCNGLIVRSLSAVLAECLRAHAAAGQSAVLAIRRTPQRSPVFASVRATVIPNTCIKVRTDASVTIRPLISLPLNGLARSCTETDVLAATSCFFGLGLRMLHRRMTPRPVQHGGGVELAPCSSRSEPPSVLHPRADCGGRLFAAKLGVVVHYLSHQLLDHLLADEPILLARQFCDCLCDRVNDFICFGGIDFV